MKFKRKISTLINKKKLPLNKKMVQLSLIKNSFLIQTKKVKNFWNFYAFSFN